MSRYTQHLILYSITVPNFSTFFFFDLYILKGIQFKNEGHNRLLIGFMWIFVFNNERKYLLRTFGANIVIDMNDMMLGIQKRQTCIITLSVLYKL